MTNIIPLLLHFPYETRFKFFFFWNLLKLKNLAEFALQKFIQTKSMKKLIYKKSRQFVLKSFVSGLNPVTRIWGRVWQISPWTRSKRSLLESERRIICTISGRFFWDLPLFILETVPQFVLSEKKNVHLPYKFFFFSSTANLSKMRPVVTVKYQTLKSYFAG